MSRYTLRIQYNDKPHTLAWGFDHACGYFISLEDLTIDSDYASDAYVFNDSNYMSLKPSDGKDNHTNGYILTQYEKFKEYIPESHLLALAGDLRF